MTRGFASAEMRAAAMVLAAMALIGLIDNFIRQIAPIAGLWQFHLLRAAAVMVLLLPMLALRGGWPRSWRAVMARSALASLGLILYFGCLGALPVALVAAGLFTAPLWLVLFAALAGQRPSSGRLAAVALGFAGVVVMLWPSEAGGGWIMALPVLAGAAYGGSNLATRLWCREESPRGMLLLFFVFMGLWGAAGLIVLPALGVVAPEGAGGWPLRGWVAPTPLLWAVVAVQAAGSMIAVTLMVRAYQIGEPPRVAVLENSLLIFAALWGLALYGEVPSGREIMGMAMILVAAAIAR